MQSDSFERLIDERKKTTLLRSKKVVLSRGLDAFLLVQPEGAGIIREEVYVYFCGEGNCGLAGYAYTNSSGLEITVDRRKAQIYAREKRNGKVWFTLSIPAEWVR
jgi:hypothetical protein